MKTLDKNEMRAIEGGKTYVCEKCSDRPTFNSWFAYAMQYCRNLYV